jgi:hypothetical protein
MKEVSLDSDRSKVQCTVFERWEEIGSNCVRCGAKNTFELSATVGIGAKSSETLESSIQGSIGVAGISTIKSQVKGTSSQEVNWDATVSTKLTYTCEAPKCGHFLLVVHQLMREYELIHFRRGSWPFRSDVWDWKWDEALVEAVEKFDAIPDAVEYDEICKCPPKDSPDYDGRLSCELGDLSIRAPYKLNPNGFQVRIGKHVVSFTFMNYAAGIRGMEQGFTILLPKEAITEPLRCQSSSDPRRDQFLFFCHSFPGHCSGPIPAPGSFAASAFPVPPERRRSLR